MPANVNKFDLPYEVLLKMEVNRLRHRGCPVSAHQLDQIFRKAREGIDYDAITTTRSRLFAERKTEVGESYTTDYPGPWRFLFADFWLLRAVGNVAQLSLDTIDKKLTILDLGTGCGYFLSACRALGHEVRGLDAPPSYQRQFRSTYEDIFSVVLKAQGLKESVVYELLTPECQLQSFPSNEFDLITAFRANFFVNLDGSKWTQTDFESFIQNLGINLSEDGRILLECNPKISKIISIDAIQEKYKNTSIAITW
jgi:hypothetical protein